MLERRHAGDGPERSLGQRYRGLFGSRGLRAARNQGQARRVGVVAIREPVNHPEKVRHRALLDPRKRGAVVGVGKQRVERPQIEHRTSRNVFGSKPRREGRLRSPRLGDKGALPQGFQPFTPAFGRRHRHPPARANARGLAGSRASGPE